MTVNELVERLQVLQSLGFGEEELDNGGQQLYVTPDNEFISKKKQPEWLESDSNGMWFYV